MKKLLSSLVLALALGASFGASAGTATGSLPVSATVTNSCVLLAPGSVNFNNYDPTATGTGNASSFSTSLNIRCTKGAAVSVTMDQGVNPTAASTCDTPARQLISGTNKLAYSIQNSSFKEFGCSGQGVYSTTTTSGTSLQQVNYSGSIAKGIDVPAGAYTDTITVGLTF